ncbi:MAG: hypothetical protein PWQ74_573 [Methanobacteriaceae archaeon]|nr:hypothetical protein [Methanobacteriaceae archaeon]
MGSNIFLKRGDRTQQSKNNSRGDGWAGTIWFVCIKGKDVVAFWQIPKLCLFVGKTGPSLLLQHQPEIVSHLKKVCMEAL